MTQETERHVQSLMSGLQILEAFDQDRGLRLKDLHERTGLNRSRILRFAGTLRAAGFLEYDENEGLYFLGPKLYALGWMLHERFSRISDLVRPGLKRLVKLNGDTAFYSIVQGTERLVVAREESPDGLRFTIQEGQTRPLHIGATSKVLLAFGPDSLMRRVLDDAAMVNDPSGLAADIASVQRQGVAVSRGEATPHGFAVSVPVPRQGQAGCDALTIAGPLAKLTDELVAIYTDHLTKEAHGLAAALSNVRGQGGVSLAAAQ
ncbi:IclR family transcriptional regulator [Microvirga pudoricolor]|uniref:IclR family transcriptional regulator n=1 Tax=Microvirga pudoricolor TaxID=2778729 RepID=UPI00194DE0DE|nr:IclR family transcriptional regulator [Microvirga pudoricolor]MBM6596545.1 IclR family transcriptional regulator [Microvirga pudoricolor]